MSRANIALAVRRVDVIQIDPGLARIIVHWLGQYADLATQRHGCPPEGLTEVQYTLAEVCVSANKNSRQHQENGLTATQPLVSGHDSEFGTTETAALLGITASCVRYHCERGNLKSRRCGRQLMITATSIAELKARRNNR